MVWKITHDSCSTAPVADLAHENRRGDETKEIVRFVLPSISDDHSGWTAWVQLRGSRFSSLSSLERQKEKLLKLVEMVNALKEKNKENERRVEMQQHELLEQETILRELYTALQMKNDPSLLPSVHLLQRKDIPKEFWLFRKHQRNLMRITEPYINQVIEASVEADIVPSTLLKKVLKPAPALTSAAQYFTKPSK
ncbi:hypothetical protein GBAR_LOCUS30292 [Geodia barretti]|uniref:Uncharacterized protein n=1 Tax=Geodia barretti TaxID=519541 RepID=A0AA35TYP1_GEOBA|nr:hypothetical protein GBAR_LOCUS30292 [Geodia barretti]